jgi:hypothetical protein
MIASISRKGLFQTILAMTLCLGLIAPSFAARRSAAVSSADGTPQWVRHSIDGNGSIDLVDHPNLDGAQAYRFTVPDDGVSYRAELATAPAPWGNYRYQFAIFVPQDWRQNDQASIVAQWHGYKLDGGKDTNPPVSLAIEGDHWRLMVNHLASPTQVEKKEFTLPALKTGVWHRFDMRIHWSQNGQSGLVDLSHDGENWVHYEGVNNYDQKNPPYFKVGIYHPQWNPRKEVPHTTGGAPIVVYTAGVKMSAD